MLSRLLIVRLKAAENAVKAGRYDDAFRLATEPDLREHRRGASVLQKLTDKFIERARAHFKADRFAEALLDLTKAEAGGVRKTEIAELREQVRVVAEEELRQKDSRRLQLEAARRRIERGSLAAGRRLLEDAVPDDAEAKALHRHAERNAEEAGEKLDQVQKLLSGGQIREAIDRLVRAKALDPQALRVVELEAKLGREVLARARKSVDAGRVGRAADELASLGDVAAKLPERSELEEMIRQAQRTARALAENRFDDLRQEAGRLAHLLPDVKWVKLAADQLRQVDGLLLGLRAGPLGQAVGADVDGTAAKGKTASPGTERPAPSLAETVAVGRPIPGTLPERLLLLVDGGGSYLLHRGERVSLGRAAASRPADVPIYSDLSERHAEIARVDDDYFLFASREVEVAGRPTRHQLLQDGNRVVMARRAKFTFRLPSRKSSSAVLEMSDSTRLPNDVRRVVMFRQMAMMGVGKTAHVSCGAADRGLLLFERSGRLWVRPQSKGGIETEARPVTIGQSMEMCGVSFVIEPWESGSPGQVRV